MFSQTNRLNSYFLKPILYFVSVFFWLASFSVANAASLYFSPSSGSYQTGQTFSVSVFTGSPDQAMNAVSGTVSFPSDKLEVVSVSKSNSIVSLWVQEPSFSNGAGTVNFEGIVLNPGYIGSGGRAITINFRSKQAGVAALTFSASSVLANDGKGTNILTSVGAASFSLGSEPEESTTSSITSGAPNAPKITSPTHPDSSKWYPKSDATFEWSISSDTTSSRVLYDKFPYSQPTVVYNASVTKRELTGITDGVWYFHAQLSNESGRSAIAHFRFRIDTEKPEYLNVREVEKEDKTDPQVSFTFDARDKTSGIDHFEIKIDDQPSAIWKGGPSDSYKTKPIAPGDHTLFVKAFDKAGNYVTDTLDFTVEPLIAPTITNIKKEINKGENLTFQGKTEYSGTGDVVLVRIQDDSGTTFEETVNVINSDGTFSFVYTEKLDNGSYSMWLRAKDNRGAESNDSAKVNFMVNGRGFFAWISSTINYLSVILVLVLLAGAIIGSVLYATKKLSGFKTKVRSEASVAQDATAKAFATLRDEVKKQISMLDGKATLSESEKRIYNKLKDALNISERYITRKIRDINGR